MSLDKTTTLAEAIRKFVGDDMTVAIEGFTHLIPFAAAHEIIRQNRTGLTLCRMTPDIVADMMVAAGCVKKLVASFFASGSSGSLYELRRRIEDGDPVPLEVEEYSHHASVLRYYAGATGLPFMPIGSFVGSDMPRANQNIRVVQDPFSGETSYAVAPLVPDVAIIHAQRADRRGNVQIWGITGVQQEAVYAARHSIVLVEQVVDEEVIRADPNRTIIPSHAVSAIVEVPFGAHPSYAQGYYDRDGAFYQEWKGISHDRVRLKEWIDAHVRGTHDHAEYLELVGSDQLDSIKVASKPSGTVDYGRRPDTATTLQDSPTHTTAGNGAKGGRID